MLLREQRAPATCRCRPLRGFSAGIADQPGAADDDDPIDRLLSRVKMIGWRVIVTDQPASRHCSTASRAARRVRCRLWRLPLHRHLERGVKRFLTGNERLANQIARLINLYTELFLGKIYADFF